MISKAELEAMGCVFWMPNPNKNDVDLVSGIQFGTTQGDDNILTIRTSDGNKSSKFSSGGILNTSSTPSLNFSTELTINVWVKFSSYSQYQILIGKGGSPFEFSLGTSITSGKLYAYIGASCTEGVISPFIPLNTLSMLTMTYNSGVVKFYINSKFDSQTTVATTTIPTSGNTKFIGIENDGHLYPMVGNLGNIMLFNKALSEEQINHIYEKTYIR